MRKILLNIFAVIFQAAICSAYDTDNVHPVINISALEQSKVDAYLKDQLGYPDGIKKVFNSERGSKRIIEWIKDGAKLEDATICRSKFHFHDPTKSFDGAGLGNLAVDAICANFRHRSSLLWSQDADNLWSWQNARKYYYQALTSSDNASRERKFADTFRALGQVMHLLSDSSVPEHTRNDIHVFPILDNQNFRGIGRWTYETWCKYNFLGLNMSGSAIGDILTDNPPVSGLAPITNLWDAAPSAGYGWPIGLAEYSNYNFLSNDTIFKDYPSPQRPNTYTLESVVAEDGTTDARVYFQGTTSHGENIAHLASAGYFLSELSATSPEGMNDSRFNLDDNVFKDYAAFLVPRAVGYSAGLLNYFFRGDMNIKKKPAAADYEILNNSEEEMDGTFELWYDNASEQRRKIWSSSLSLGGKSSGNNKADLTGFSAPDDPLEEGKYMLVFRGRMGNEEDAVAARMINLGSDYLFMVGVEPSYGYYGGPISTLTYKITTDSSGYSLIPAEGIEIDMNIHDAHEAPSLSVVSTPDKSHHEVFLSWRGQGPIKNYGVLTWACYSGDYYPGNPSCFNINAGARMTIVPFPDGYMTIQHDYAVNPGEEHWTAGRNNYGQNEEGYATSYAERVYRVHTGNSGFYHFGEAYRYGLRYVEGDVLKEGVIAEDVADAPYSTIQNNESCSDYEVTLNNPNGRSIRNNVLAAIGNKKILNVIDDISWSESPVITQADFCGEESTCMNISTSLGRGTVRLMFGDDEIHKGDTFYPSNVYGAKMQSYACSDTWPAFDYKDRDIRVLDYDGRNGDEKYLLFYAVSSYIETYDQYSGASSSYFIRYYVAYKTPGGGVIKEQIAEYSPYDDSEGTLVDGVSVQMNDKNIVYTYNLFKEDFSVWPFPFEKRVIGIINIGDERLPIGHRQEFELDSSEAGFDPSWYAAIGVANY